MTLCGAAAHAADGDTFEYKGLNYMVTNEATHEVQVAKNPNATGDIEIPAQVVGPASKNYTVTSIATNAFLSCDITSVKIPDTVTYISVSAFYKCENLTKAEFASIESLCSIEFYDRYANPLYSARYLWIDGQEISNLVIPNTVTAVSSYAFVRCLGLTSVEVPNSVVTIGGEAFYKCENLTKVEFASIESVCNIKFIDYYANPLSEAGYLWIDGKEITDLVIPNTVTAIGDYAFTECNSLTSVKIPNSVVSIGKDAFICERLTKAEFASIESLCNIKFKDITANPLSSANHLWIDGKEITDLVIPSTVTAIGDFAFAHCIGLTSVEIPNSVTSIGCSAFEYCKNIPSVNIPNSVISIDMYAFESCEKLTSVYLPASLNLIASGAFNNCLQLSSVYYNTENPIESVDELGFTPFSNTPEDATLYVPEVAVEKCKTIQPWQSFKNIVAYDFSGIEETVTDFDADAPCAVYNIGGVKVGNSTDNLPAGIYIVRKGNTAKEIAVK